MPRFRSESPLTESSSGDDADSAYELEHSSDEETDVKPRTVPKHIEKIVAAAEMFDPVDAGRKCYRCWKLGVDCLLPFERDQVDSKCNRCEKDRRSYCNVNDRPAVRLINCTAEVRFYGRYYEALHKKHTGEDPVSTDFDPASMDMDIINADEDMTKMHQLLSAKQAALARKREKNRRRAQVDQGTGPLNEHPCYHCKKNRYTCRSAKEEAIKKDPRNKDRCHVCIGRAGRCNANKVQPRFGEGTKAELLRKYYAGLEDLVNSDKTGCPWVAPDSDIKPETLEVDLVDKFGLRRRYEFVMQDRAKADSKGKALKSKEKQRSIKRDGSQEDGASCKNGGQEEEEDDKNSNRSERRSQYKLEAARIKRSDSSSEGPSTRTLATPAPPASTPHQSTRSPHQDNPAITERRSTDESTVTGSLSNIESLAIDEMQETQEADMPQLADNGQDADTSSRDTYWESLCSSPTTQPQAPEPRRSGDGLTQETAIDVDTSDEESLKPLRDSKVLRDQSAKQVKQEDDGGDEGVAVQVGTSEAATGSREGKQQQDRKKQRGQSRYRSEPPLFKRMRAGLNLDEIRAAGHQREACSRAYEAWMTHKRSEDRLKEAETNLEHADEQLQLLIVPRLHHVGLRTSSKEDERSKRQRHVAESRLEAVKEEVASARLTEEETKTLLASCLEEVPRDSWEHIRNSVEEEMSRERRGRRKQKAA